MKETSRMLVIYVEDRVGLKICVFYRQKIKILAQLLLLCFICYLKTFIYLYI